MTVRLVRRAICTSLFVAASTAADAQHEGHGVAKPLSTVSDWSRGARLFDGLGSFHRAASTKIPKAQHFFDQGMRFLWAFNHDEATRSFAKAAEFDPECAVCYWGVALTLGPNYNMPLMSDARAQAGSEALSKAQANSPAASAVEQALIAALEKRYAGSTALDPSNSAPLLASYVAAMRDVARRFPKDADVQVLFAEALMNTNPWKLWNADGTAGTGTPEIVKTLTDVLATDPKHPGANHYWVHTIEASPNPEKGLAAAETLNGMMPAAGHMEHMPSHIMQRVGRYEEAAEANRKGAAADLKYLGMTAAPDYYPMYLIHNYQFLAFSSAMEGRKAETMAALRKARSSTPDAMLLAMPGFDWSIGFLYDGLVRFSRWDEILKEPRPTPKLVGLTIAYHQARASAFAAKRRLKDARSEAAKAAKLAAGVRDDATQGMSSAATIYKIGQKKVEARIALAERRRSAAIGLLREAAAIEDTLAYNEPEDVFFPVRHLLGAALLKAGRFAEAEATYKKDLEDHPNNGWALAGLAAALAAQKRNSEAAAARRRFTVASKRADVNQGSSPF